jgi:hypothetical protein
MASGDHCTSFADISTTTAEQRHLPVLLPAEASMRFSARRRPEGNRLKSIRPGKLCAMMRSVLFLLNRFFNVKLLNRYDDISLTFQ